MADKAHSLTDKEVEKMERHLTEIYERASKEIVEKTDKYFSRFAELDEQKKKLVDDGKLSEEDYKRWRQNKIMTGKHWTQMKEQTAQELLNANKAAQKYINNQLPNVYAINYNATGKGIAGTVSGYSFELVDASTVKNMATSDKTLLPYKYVDGKKDVRWNTQKVNSEVLQGIIQGESIPNIAKRLRNVTEMNRASAIRNARTTTTSAENKGRMDSYQRAQEKGVRIVKVWMATTDGRTRDEHIELDGQEREIDEPFENSLGAIMYPGDPEADPGNVYNCRCTMITRVLGFDGEDAEAEDAVADEAVQVSAIAEGKDISGTWERRPDEFAFEIEDVINAQGFDGLPRVVSQEEFDKAVAESSFIAQRTYSAPDQETLDLYRHQLYSGEWYVDCSTGGAQYGQGMYCAADYTGTLTEGIRAEMDHYVELNLDRTSRDFSSMEEEEQRAKLPGVIDELFPEYTEEQKADLVTFLTYDRYDESGELVDAGDARSARQRLIDSGISIGKAAHGIEEYTFEGKATVETLTLDPSARIIELDDLMAEQRRYSESVYDAAVEQALAGYSDTEMALYRYTNAVDTKEDRAIVREYKAKHGDEYAELMERKKDEWKEIERGARQQMKEAEAMDSGAFAAMLGYDAINASGHGESGSYTVILNRTKVIFLGGGN